MPVGVLGVVAGLLFIPRSRELRARAPLDWSGLGLFVPAVAAFLVAISVGERWRWGSPGVVALLALGVAAGLGFLARERTARHPMLDLDLFRVRAFSLGIASALLAYLVTFGVLLVAPFCLERALALGPGQAGLDLMVMPLALGVVAVLAGRAGLPALTTLGLLVVAAALGVLVFSTPTSVRLVVGLAVVGAGLGLFTPANNASIMSAVPREQSGEASGVVNVTRGVGTSLGLALTGLIFAIGGGDGSTTPGVVAGYHDAAAFLAVAALVAALITWELRGRAGAPGRPDAPRPPSPRRGATRPRPGGPIRRARA